LSGVYKGCFFACVCLCDICPFMGAFWFVLCVLYFFLVLCALWTASARECACADTFKFACAPPCTRMCVRASACVSVCREPSCTDI
jgi:hypothetical protein